MDYSPGFETESESDSEPDDLANDAGNETNEDTQVLDSETTIGSDEVAVAGSAEATNKSSECNSTKGNLNHE